MPRKLTENGISTTTELDTFAFEYCLYGHRHGGGLHRLVQWDYRDAAGVLHRGITKTVREAEAAARAFGYKGHGFYGNRY